MHRRQLGKPTAQLQVRPAPRKCEIKVYVAEIPCLKTYNLTCPKSEVPQKTKQQAYKKTNAVTRNHDKLMPWLIKL